MPRSPRVAAAFCSRTASARLLSPRFYRAHLLLPLLIFVVLSIALMGLHGDQWIAGHLYAWEGHAWRLQDDPILQGVLHSKARNFVKLCWYVLLAMWLLSLAPLRVARTLRWPLLYLVLSTIVSTAIVGWMKTWTTMDCPWDLAAYGGHDAYVGLFQARPAGYPMGECFPAGHASAGYCWLALYFFFLYFSPRLRWLGLAVGTSLGVLFGLVQQLRGAHFMSHDLWTAMISWGVALGLFQLLLLIAPQRAGVLHTSDSPPTSTA